MQYGRARVRTEGLVVALIRVDVLLLGAAANRQTRQDKTRHDKTGAPSVTCQHAYGLSAPHAMSVQFSSGSRSHKRRATCKKPPLFVSVPYVCPEPVLAKRSFSHRNNWLKKSVSQLFLCLSRACLGKMIIYIYKWLKKECFSHPSSARSSQRAVEAAGTARKARQLFQRCFSSVRYFQFRFHAWSSLCPKPVLAGLSWQIGAFDLKA